MCVGVVGVVSVVGVVGVVGVVVVVVGGVGVGVGVVVVGGDVWAPGLLYRRASGFFFFRRGAQTTARKTHTSYSCAPLLRKLTKPPRRSDMFPHEA